MKKAEIKKDPKEKDMEKDNNINDTIELKGNENEIINVIDKEDEDVCKKEEKINRKKYKFKNYDVLDFLYNIEVGEENYLIDSGDTMLLGLDIWKKYKKRLFSFSKDSIDSTRVFEHFPRNKFSFVKEDLNICGLLEQKYDLSRSMPDLKNDINLKGK